MNTTGIHSGIKPFRTTINAYQKRLWHSLGRYQKIALSMAAACLFILSGTAHAQDPVFDWVKAMGSQTKTGEELFCIAMDNENNVLTGGMFYDTAQFPIHGSNPFNFTALGKQDLFIAKQNDKGEFLWVKHLGGKAFEKIYGITSDAARNVYVAGYIQDSMFVEPGANPLAMVAPFMTGKQAWFIAKFDEDGNYQWIKRFGSEDVSVASAIVADSAGNIYIGGNFRGTCDFNTDNPGIDTLASGGGNDGFIAKYTTDGDFVWAKSISGDKNESVLSLDIDYKGYLYAAGQLGGGDVSFGDKQPRNIQGNSMFVAKLDTAGSFDWEYPVSGPYVSSVAVDYQGNVLSSGTFYGDIYFNPPSTAAGFLSATGDQDGFILKLDNTGAFSWVAQVATKEDEMQVFSVATDRVGNIYSAGFFTVEADFDPGADTFNLRTTDWNYNPFLWKLNPDGNFVWAKQLVGLNDRSAGEGNAITLDQSGNIYTAGRFNGSLDFDPGADTTSLEAYGTNVFTHKLLCTDTSTSIIRDSICSIDAPYLFDGRSYDKSGTYKQIYSSIQGCDSVIILELTINNINKPVININNFTLGIDQSQQYESYQWLLNGSAIPGATNDQYTLTQNGDYQVAVGNKAGCIDTSDIYTVTNAGIEDINTLAGAIKVYPNPATDKIIIQSPVKVNIALTDVTGRTVKQVADAQQVSLSSLAAGIYLLRITNQAGTLIKVEKVVKQEQ